MSSGVRAASRGASTDESKFIVGVASIILSFFLENVRMRGYVLFGGIAMILSIFINADFFEKFQSEDPYYPTRRRMYNHIVIHLEDDELEFLRPFLTEDRYQRLLPENEPNWKIICDTYVILSLPNSNISDDDRNQAYQILITDKKEQFFKSEEYRVQVRNYLRSNEEYAYREFPKFMKEWDETGVPPETRSERRNKKDLANNALTSQLEGLDKHERGRMILENYRSKRRQEG